MKPILFRDVIIALLAGVIALLISFEIRLTGHELSRHRGDTPIRIEMTWPPAPAPTCASADDLRVIDIRREDLERVGLHALLGLGHGDRIETVNDTPTNDPAYLLALVRALHSKGAAEFLDLGVSRRGQRVRMVVLLHG